MLQIKDLVYAIGNFEILSKISWVIQPGKKAALIGNNGVGKTTLLRILNRELDYNAGEIIKPGRYQIGYLPQEEITLDNQQVLQTVLEGQKEVLELKRHITSIYNTLNKVKTSNEQLLNQLAGLEQKYESLDGFKLELKAKSILSGLGFNKEDFTRPLLEFSGGWKMRVYLARLLVLNPDLLLLDEPTNHLDLPSLEWLEQYLQNFTHSIIIVSHDRFFIDRIASEIYELEGGKINRYAGNYHFYEQKKAEQLEILKKQREKQNREKQHLQKYIDRFRYKATKAAQAQSKIKQLTKMKDSMDIPSPTQTIRFNLKVNSPSFKHVLDIKDMSFKYDGDWVFNKINLDIYREEKVSIVGINGAGKTTLSKLIAGQLEPVTGSVTLGERTKIGYYSQHRIDSLDPEATIYDEVCCTIDSQHVPAIRDILGIFQFRGDDIFKRIKVLSGGEKARVSLAKILLSPVNFLLMDEPTNHLDKISREALEIALRGYNGTLLLISHDRYFLDKIVSRVIEIEKMQIIEYPGNYTEYLEKREIKSRETKFFGDNRIPPSDKKSRKLERQTQAKARQSVSSERNRIEKEIKDMEIQIEELEREIQKIETVLADSVTYENGKKVTDLGKKYANLKKELQNVYAGWESNQLKLDSLLTRLSE